MMEYWPAHFDGMAKKILENNNALGIKMAWGLLLL